MAREETWWLRSQKDPRWNSEGIIAPGNFWLSGCGKVMVAECQNAYEEKKAELGEEPADLQWGCWNVVM